MAIITGITRFIACQACGQKQMVKDLLSHPTGPHCISCRRALCGFCGCTDDVPCFYEDYPREAGFTCAWFDRGVCDFCHWQIAEAEYYKAIDQPEKIREIRHRKQEVVLV